jgi:hypothetical protein
MWDLVVHEEITRLQRGIMVNKSAAFIYITALIYWLQKYIAVQNFYCNTICIMKGGMAQSGEDTILRHLLFPNLRVIHF